MTGIDLRDLFAQAGCRATLCLIDVDSDSEVSLDADTLVVAGSVFKVAVALEAERQFTEGRLDPRERVVLASTNRTPGPVGFSLFQDDIEVSLRDLVPAMLTISDNVATDALLHRVGIDTVNASMAALGLHDTVITADLSTIINSIGHDAGFTGWDDMQRWWAQPRPADQTSQAHGRLLAAKELRPATATRTTARQMTTLLRLIWRNQAAPAAACQRVRTAMSRQLTKHRLASGFPPPTRISAKSGGLAGIIRNEVGVIEYPNGRRYAAAVFTHSDTGEHDQQINAAIGHAAAHAVNHLSTPT